MQSSINLEILNDNQKIWLSQLSYLNINSLGVEKIMNGGLTISELSNYLEKPEEPFCGKLFFDENGFYKIADSVTGENKVPTRQEMLQSIINSGLGDLKIKNISSSHQTLGNGFQAMTFEDSYGNTGISYRGSDFDVSKGALGDWLEADFLEYFKNDSNQRREALKYFESNKNLEGNNYLYGHSLGGNLTSHVYAENYNQINEAFTINGNPINQKLLDTPEKIAAFNDPEKYSCNLVCGDIVGNFKSFDLYKNNVNFIKNNETMKPNFVTAHLVQSATYDENGNFVLTNEEEMKQKLAYGNLIFDFVKDVRENLNGLWDKHQDLNAVVQPYIQEWNSRFNELANELGLNKTSEQKQVDEFKNAVQTAELEDLERIKKQILEQSQLNNKGESLIDEPNQSYSR